MSCTKKMLSIGIPTWNRLTYLKELLNEIVNQIISFKLESQIEIVICDNASTDGTYDFLKHFSKRHSFVKIFHNDSNLGAKTNVILTLQRASSRYILLIGDDDRIRFNSLHEILNELRLNPETIILIDESKSKYKNSGINEISIEFLVRYYYWYMGNAGCFIISSDYIDDLIKKHGTNFFNECWPQTQIMILSYIIAPNRKILLRDLAIVTESKHDNVMIYSSYYLWRTCVLELHNAITSLHNLIPYSIIRECNLYLNMTVKQNSLNILQCAIFIDDPINIKKTTTSIILNLKTFSIKEKLWYLCIYIILLIPKGISKKISNTIIFLFKGKKGLLKKEAFVQKELNKIKLMKCNEGSIRSLDFENIK